MLNGKLYVIGGGSDQATASAVNNACRTIDLASGEHRQIAPLPVPSFMVGAAAACAGRIFVFGGGYWDLAAAEVRNLDAAFAYDAAKDTWQPLPKLPSANRGITAVTLDDHRILLAGGYKNDVEEVSSETFIFDTTANTYTAGPALPLRAMVALVVHDGYVYSLGGEDRKQHRSPACYRIAIKTLAP